MRICYSGTNFPHEKGEFSHKGNVDLYGVFYFYTPYVYEKEGVLHHGRKGDLLLSAPGETVLHGPCSNDESFVNDWMYVSKDFGEILKKYPIPTITGINIGKSTDVYLAIKEVQKEQDEKNAGYEDKVDCILTEMVINLYRAYSGGKLDTSQSIVESVHAQVMQSPELDWTLEKMAALSGYSANHFSAIYSNHYGISPKQSLLQKRLGMAEQMLVYTKLSIGEIATRCGFQSIYYFSKYFKKHCGLSPSEFAKRKT